MNHPSTREAVHIRIDQLPSFSSSAIALLGKRPRVGKEISQTTIPPITAEIEGLRIAPGATDRYHQVCGFTTHSGVAATYPQVATTPLTMTLFRAPQFPLPVLGLIHLSNHITQRRPLVCDVPYHFCAQISRSWTSEKGLHFEVVTEARERRNEDLPDWTSVAEFLSVSRAKPPRKSGERPAIPEETVDLWSLTSGLGRSYAKVSGDYNPIHLSGITARPFGFRRPIIHGMWTLARSLASLTQSNPLGEGSLKVHFKRPILLPARVNLTADHPRGDSRFAVVSEDQEQVHAIGEIQRHL